MILAWIVVIGVSLYGAVRCFLFEEFLAGCKILLVLPLWFGAQTLFGLVENATGAQFFENGVAIIYYVAGATLVCYFVIRHVRWLTVPPPGDGNEDPHESWFSMQDPRVIKRRAAGLVFIIIGAVAMASAFLVEGALFIVVGVSLVMDVRIWRR